MANPTPTPTLGLDLAALGGSAYVTQGPNDNSTSHHDELRWSFDIKVPSGTPIYLPADAVVIAVLEDVASGTNPSRASGLGNYLSLWFPTLNKYGMVAHLAPNSVIPDVDFGKVLPAGTQVATVGNTGAITGTHVHWTFGSVQGEWTIGAIADGSDDATNPFRLDTATGELAEGAVSIVNFDLTQAESMPAGLAPNLTLLGAADISGRGTAAANVISGNRGDNVLEGRAGNDQLFGGGGKDTLDGGADNDLLDGGTNSDTATYSLATAGVKVSLALQGVFQQTGGAGSDRLLSIENLTGSRYSDALTGDSGRNVLSGGDGNDVIRGGGGKDTLFGGPKSDRFQFASGDSPRTNYDIVKDMAPGAVGVGDVIDYLDAPLRIGGSSAAATSSQAQINQASGMAKYANGSGKSLTDATNDIAARFTAAGDLIGEFAFFNLSGTLHMFISDGRAGVSANDLVVELMGLTSVSSIAISGGDLTILG